MPVFVIKRPNALRVAAIKKQNTLNIIDAIKNQQASRVNAMKNMLTLRAAKNICTKENFVKTQYEIAAELGIKTTDM